MLLLWPSSSAEQARSPIGTGCSPIMGQLCWQQVQLLLQLGGNSSPTATGIIGGCKGLPKW